MSKPTINIGSRVKVMQGILWIRDTLIINDFAHYWVDKDGYQWEKADLRSKENTRFRIIPCRTALETAPETLEEKLSQKRVRSIADQWGKEKFVRIVGIIKKEKEW